MNKSQTEQSEIKLFKFVNKIHMYTHLSDAFTSYLLNGELLTFDFKSSLGKMHPTTCSNMKLCCNLRNDNVHHNRIVCFNVSHE